jgi:hypothetical protein
LTVHLGRRRIASETEAREKNETYKRRRSNNIKHIADKIALSKLITVMQFSANLLTPF